MLHTQPIGVLLIEPIVCLVSCTGGVTIMSIEVSHRVNDDGWTNFGCLIA